MAQVGGDMEALGFGIIFTLGLLILMLTIRRVYIELDKLDGQIDDLLIVFVASISVMILSLVGSIDSVLR